MYYLLLFFIIKLVSLSWFYSFMIFTAYPQFIFYMRMYCQLEYMIKKMLLKVSQNAQCTGKHLFQSILHRNTIYSNLQNECQTRATRVQLEQHEFNTSVTQQYECDTSETRVQHQQHECNTSATRTARARHE